MHASTCVIVGLMALPAGVPAQEEPIGIIVIRDGDRQVETLRESIERHEIDGSPIHRAARRNPGFVQAQVGLLGISAMAGMSPWEGIGSLLGERTVIGVAPGPGEEPRLVAVSTLREPKRADRFIDAILATAGLTIDGEPVEGATRTIAGEAVFVADELLVCRVDDALVVANDRGLIEAALIDLDDGKLDLTPQWEEARGAVPHEAGAWASVDLSALRGAGMEIHEKLPDAFGALLIGGWARSLADADRVVAWATTEPEGMSVSLDMHREGAWPETHRGYLAGDGAATPISLEGMIGEISVSRDWATIFGEREALLTLDASGELVEFATNLTAIMGQLDFIDEVLPRVTGPMRLLAVQRDGGVEATPSLPGLALVTGLDLEGVDLAQRLYSGGQMLMTIVNFERAGQGQPSMIMDMQEHRGVRLISGSFGEPAVEGIASVEYNFEPGLAIVDGTLVIASRRELLTRIVDEVLDAEGADEAASVQDRAWVDGAQLASILGENREELIANQMLEEGKSRERASSDIDALLHVLRRLDRVEMDASTTPEGTTATLRLTLEAP